MMTDFETIVNDRIVPVRGAWWPTLVYFADDLGAHDNPGVYAFWTAVTRTNGTGITGRARVGLPAGDRADRMAVAIRTDPSRDARRAYADMLYREMRDGDGILYIRPSTSEELDDWAATHESDWRWARWKLVGRMRSVMSIEPIATNDVVPKRRGRPPLSAPSARASAPSRKRKRSRSRARSS